MEAMAAREPTADLAWVEVKSCLLLLAKSSLAPSLELNYIIFEGKNISVIESTKLFMILITLLTICSPIILDTQKGSLTLFPVRIIVIVCLNQLVFITLI